MRGGSKAAGAPEAREKICAAASRLFSLRGFDATTTKAIADEAGVPAGLVFYYFERKEGLLEELLSRENVFVEIRRALEDTRDEPVSRALLEVALRAFRWVEHNREQAMMFFKELSSHRRIADDLQKLRQAGIEAIKQSLDGYRATGRLAPTADTETIARILVSTILIGALVDRPADPEAFMESVVETLFRGAGLPEID